MSALPPKADIRRRPFDVGFGPKAEGGEHIQSLVSSEIASAEPLTSGMI